MSRVNRRQSSSPLAFEGALFRCGQEIDEAQLWPGPEYPAVPVLLEHGGVLTIGSGHRRSEQLYILWRYEREAATWAEIARAASAEAEWVHDLFPIAERALADQRTPTPTDWRDAADRLLGLVDRQLDDFSTDERRQKVLLHRLYDGLTHRLVETVETPIYQHACDTGYNARRGPTQETRTLGSGALSGAGELSGRPDGQSSRSQAIA